MYLYYSHHFYTEGYIIFVWVVAEAYHLELQVMWLASCVLFSICGGRRYYPLIFMSSLVNKMLVKGILLAAIAGQSKLDLETKRMMG
jgi:hypothetical protein